MDTTLVVIVVLIVKQTEILISSNKMWVIYTKI